MIMALICGMALMVYPYFIANAPALVCIGLVLLAVPCFYDIEKKALSGPGLPFCLLQLLSEKNDLSPFSRQNEGIWGFRMRA
jgi:hypothetical protein